MSSNTSVFYKVSPQGYICLTSRSILDLKRVINDDPTITAKTLVQFLEQCFYKNN